MHTIIAGRIGTLDRADQVRQMLLEHGIAHDDIQCFYVNPPGQHDLTPIGGDVDRDPGVAKASAGQAVGAAAGATAGLVAGAVAASVVAPLVAPALLVGLTGVGAHVGGLAGAVSSGRDGEDEERATETSNPGPDARDTRRGGLMVAVRVSPATESLVIDVLRASDAGDIERAQGQWRDGGWADFDPRLPPRKIDAGVDIAS